MGQLQQMQFPMKYSTKIQFCTFQAYVRLDCEWPAPKQYGTWTAMLEGSLPKNVRINLLIGPYASAEVFPSMHLEAYLKDQNVALNGVDFYYGNITDKNPLPTDEIKDILPEVLKKGNISGKFWVNLIK
jgi:hypothetical protein